MSEEILKALMHLFAILLKQDGGVEENEIKYVANFLKSQLGEAESIEYLKIFREIIESEYKERKDFKNLTSVLDSVKILGICKKINKTLNTSQKYIVLVRLFELTTVDLKLTDQRLAIIKTVSEVFKISKENFTSIHHFILNSDEENSANQNIRFISGNKITSTLPSKREALELVVLKIPEVNMYFIRYVGNYEFFLNGLGMHKNRVYLLAKGSTIRLSHGKPLYYSDITSIFLHFDKSDKINFRVNNISYYFKNGIRGIKNISFESRHGNMVGILGSSGAGKTTLLNILAGIEKPGSGKITINGLDLHQDNPVLSGIIGYIPQDDMLIEELTVFENLYYNAKFCFKDLDEDEIKSRINATLDNLGLISKRDLKVGNIFNKTISGGQRKRLNIALELMREPSILFVDEPTSGLSSRDSENVMDLLRELTIKGKLVFVVIHQPSSEVFKMFDQVLILDEGGTMVYHGNPVEAVMYFKRIDNQINAGQGECPVCGNVNPELIFNIIEARVVDEYGNYTRKRKVEPEQWETFFQKEKNSSKEKNVYDIPERNLCLPPWLNQVFIYFRRDLKSKISNTQYLLLSLLEAPILGFLLSYIIRYIADPGSTVYKFRENENIPIYIFMALIVAVFLGLTQSAEEIFKDRKILKRERFLHLSKSAYLMSKVLILFIISGIQALMFVLVANSILELKNMNFIYWLALFTTAAFANMLGLNISASFNSAITIYIVIPLLIIPMMVLSGAMFSFEKLNRNISRVDKVPFLAEMMPTRWSYEALMVNQYKKNFFEVNYYEYDKVITNADFKLSYYLPEFEKRLDEIRVIYQKDNSIDIDNRNLLLLKNEINRESSETSIELPDKEIFNSKSFDEENIRMISNYIQQLKAYYLDIFTNSTKIKNNKVNNQLKNIKDIYYKYLDDFHNESVSDQVRKIYERKKIIENNNRLVRVAEPIYLDPEPDGPFDFRAHFFAPRKHFLGNYYDTFYFNMLVIWILTTLLYIALYYNVLKKIISFKFFSKKKSLSEPLHKAFS